MADPITTSCQASKSGGAKTTKSLLQGLRVSFIAGTLGGGGAERQLFYMVRALRDAGCAVEILSLTRGEVWEERILALGVPIHWVGRSPGRLSRLRAILGFLRTSRPHIVQSAHFFTNVYAAMAARIVGARDIGAIRSNALSEMRVYGKTTGILSLRTPRHLAANSQAGVRNAVALGVSPRRVHFLPNVLDAAHFKPGDFKKPPFHVVAVGRLGPEKRFDRFLRVVATLRESAPVCATLVGAGPLDGDLKRLVEELKLEQNIVFTGAVSDPLPFFQQAHVAFLCSEYEGTPNVLLEAQACGLPVVSTDVGGISSIVREGETGFLVDPECGEKELMDRLAAAVRSLRDNESLRARMATAARGFIESEYNMQHLPAILETLYARVLSRETAPTIGPAPD